MDPTDSDGKRPGAAARLPPDLLAEADALVPLLKARPDMVDGRVTRSTVIRMAVRRGLATLRAEVTASPTSSKRRG
jgi:hypothetical protein